MGISTQIYFPSLRGPATAQGALLPGGLFAWAEVTADRRQVHWLVEDEGGQPVAWGSDSVLWPRRSEEQERALDERMRVLQRRYGAGEMDRAG